MDEIGPISFRPNGGRGRFRAGHPARIPSTYKRRKGTRYLYLTENVYHKRLSGRFYRHKGGTFWSDYLERERSKYPADQRVYIIQDTLSAHWTPEIRRWVHAHRVTRVASATRASWMNPVGCHAGDLQSLVVAGSNFQSWAEVRREFRRAIAYRNRERRFRKTRVAGRKRVTHRRPVWKRH